MSSHVIRGREIRHDGSRNEFFHLAAKGLWEPETFEIIECYCKDGGVFIDIGGWCGVLSLYASALGAVAYCIEPDRTVYEELRANIFMNGNKVNFVPLAISTEMGIAYLNSMDNSFGNSESSLIVRERVDGKMSVNTESLQSFVKLFNIVPQEISLIKIDVEGGETLIIAGAKYFLKKYAPTMLISFHPRWIDLTLSVARFIQILFPIYTVVGMDKIVYTPEKFIEAMNSSHNHTFLFIKKSE